MFTRYQRDHIGAQALQLNYKFAHGVANIIYHVHALVLTRRIVGVNSDGSQMVDIVSKRLMTKCLLFLSFSSYFNNTLVLGLVKTLVKL